MTRLNANLPDTANGLDAITQDLLNDPLAERIVVGIVYCPKANDDFVNGRHIPYVQFRAIEPITQTTDAKAVRDILETAYMQRTGQDSLTLDSLEPDGDSDGVDG